jgi:hypothetical protein
LFSEKKIKIKNQSYEKLFQQGKVAKKLITNLRFKSARERDSCQPHQAGQLIESEITTICYSNNHHNLVFTQSSAGQ